MLGATLATEIQFVHNRNHQEIETVLHHQHAENKSRTRISVS